MIKGEEAPSQSFEDCELPPSSKPGAGCCPKYFGTASDAATTCLFRYAWLLISMYLSLVQIQITTKFRMAGNQTTSHYTIQSEQWSMMCTHATGGNTLAISNGIHI